MKLAIVHDFLNQYGGAERCVEAFHEIFPDAPIYTSIYLPDNMPESFRKMDIRTSFMQKFPFLNRHFKKYLLFYPKAIESFDLSGYDIIFSSSSSFAKGVRIKKGVLHVCYCYTPMRFVWDTKSYIEKENFNALEKKAIEISVKILQKWDLKNNTSVDYFVGISNIVKERIKNYYKRTADIIYPTVGCDNYKISTKTEDYYLVVSRLNAYKRIDIVIEAFNKLQLPLRIIGDGPKRKTLEGLAGPTITFLGKVDDIKLAEVYSQCQALLFPGVEDFGIVPLEAQASGRPVIAYAAGGALETVVDGVTGLFFKEQNPESIIDAVRRYEAIKNSFNSEIIRKNAMRFDKEIFKKKICDYVLEKYHNYCIGKNKNLP